MIRPGLKSLLRAISASTASVMVWSSFQEETNDGRLEILIATFITWVSYRVSAATSQQLLVADERPSLNFNLVNKDSLRGEKNLSLFTANICWHSVRMIWSISQLLSEESQSPQSPAHIQIPNLCSSQPQVPSTRGPKNLSMGNQAGEWGLLAPYWCLLGWKDGCEYHC